MPEGKGYTDKELSEAIKFFKTQTTMSDEQINAIPTNELVPKMKEFIMLDSDRTGPSSVTEDVPMPRKKPKKMSVTEGLKNALLNVGKQFNPIETLPVGRFIPPGTVSQAGKDFSQGVKRGFSSVGDTAKQGLGSLIGGLKKKKMNKGGYGGMAMKKPEMMKGGMYKGKKHMYAAGGLVKELKM